MALSINLIGDSVFDNSLYVGEGESIADILCHEIDGEITLMAVDGSVAGDISKQLLSFPGNEAVTFLSCGGNDALRSISMFNESAASVGDAFNKANQLKENFRVEYSLALDSLLLKTKRVIVCTIYNKVPGTSERALAALSLFNEVVLEEAFTRKLSVLDLRCVCTDDGDYSSVSPIEPSFQGGRKIASAILEIAATHKFSGLSCVYT